MASYFRFQVNRNTRRLRRNFRSWEQWFLRYSQRHIYGGWQKFAESRWLFSAWTLIIIVSLWGLFAQNNSLSSYYLTQTADFGGSYSEGIVGNVKGVNPLFPDNSATSDVTSLVFSGLTRVNNNRQIEGDLASSWEVSPDKKLYTFHLRPNTKWQDGKELTSEDIAFTINRVQNPDTRSPLAGNWNGVKYEVPDKQTIVFTLPSSYGAFLSNTTMGILPKHLLEKVRPSLLKTYEFNQKPIGSGPFKLQKIVDGQAELTLSASQNYYLGRPFLDQFRFVQYQMSDEFLAGYVKKQINGFVVNKPELEKQTKQIDDITIHHLNLPAYSALFFNTKSAAVADVHLRQALAYATDKNAIIQNQLDGQAVKISYPIFAGYSGFDNTAPRYEYDQQKAKDTLASVNAEQLKSTRLRIVTLQGSVYEPVADAVKKMWADTGVQSDVIAVPLDQLQQNYIRPRNYDVLLYGLDVGIDPDMYAYWHTSQAADPGLNLSQYSNVEADKYLETGRVAKDPAYKNARYSAFLQLWAKDEPAIILYSPVFNYAQSNAIGGLSANKLAEPSNRFLDVQKWYTQKRETTKASIR